MSQLLNLLERIEQGTGPSLGFGSSQASRLPGLALIGRCSGDLDAALAAARDSADAVVIVVSGLTPDALPNRDGLIWGVGGVPLEPGAIAMWRDAGADFAVSPLAGAQVDAINIGQNAIGQNAMLHGVRIPDDVDDDTWRILAGIPIQALISDNSDLTGPWELTRLGRVADCARRTDKHLIVRVGVAPTANELLALKQAGAVALVVEANTLGGDGMAALKADLVALQRPQPATRRRGSSLPGTGLPGTERDGPASQTI